MSQPRLSIIDISEDQVCQIAVRQAILKSRRQAIRQFVCLGLLQFILGSGFLTCAGLAVSFTQDSNRTGIPYYIGAFMAGLMVLAASLVSFFIQYKGRRVLQTAVVKRRITFAITISHVIAMLAFFASFVGVILVGIGGLCNRNDCYYDVNITENYVISIVILVLLLTALIKIVYQLCTTCSLGHYFGDVPESRRRMSRPTIIIKDESGEDRTIYGTGKGIGSVLENNSESTDGIINLAHSDSTISLDDIGNKGNKGGKGDGKGQLRIEEERTEDPPTDQPSDPPSYGQVHKVETPPPEYPGVFKV